MANADPRSHLRWWGLRDELLRRGAPEELVAVVDGHVPGAHRFGRTSVLHRAEAFSARWGAPGIFFTRWLVTALGPWVNLSSGVAAYPVHRFLFWDVVGEALWVGLYVTAGKLFSDQVTVIADLSSNLAWALVGVLLAAFFAWRLMRILQHDDG